MVHRGPACTLESEMALKALLINGPTPCDKHAIAHLVAERVVGKPIHLLRLQESKDGHTNAVEPLEPGKVAPAGAWFSAHHVAYTCDRVFETIPDALRAVNALERDAFVVVEADHDSSIRHAWPYDYRIFAMPAPTDIFEVFREPQAAAHALRQVMEDTASFATEIFGLFDANDLDDSKGIRHGRAEVVDATGQPHEVEHLDVGPSHLRHFLRSPIGAEIASRIQLQPDYHALVEADVVVISAARKGCSQPVRACVERIEKLLSRIRHDARRRSLLYWGDLTDDVDPVRRKLIRRLKVLLGGS